MIKSTLSGMVDSNHRYSWIQIRYHNQTRRIPDKVDLYHFGTRGWFRSNYKHFINVLPPHSVSLVKFFEKYAAFNWYFKQRTSVLIQLFRRQQLSNPYWTDFAYRSSSFDEDQNLRFWLGTRLLILLIVVLVFGAVEESRHPNLPLDRRMLFLWATTALIGGAMG